MKALEKDRGRRYETASGMARDLEHYLHDEPVDACPPSMTYRARKFTRRNRGPVLAAAFVLLALMVGVIGTTLGLIEAVEQRNRSGQLAKEKGSLADELQKSLTAEAIERKRAEGNL